MSRGRRRGVSLSQMDEVSPPSSMWSVLSRELITGAGALTGGGITEYTQEAGQSSLSGVLGTWSPYCYSVGFWITFIVTVVVCTVDEWLNRYYLSKLRVFYFVLWLKSLIIVGFLQVLLQKFSLSFKTRFSNARKKFLSLWPLMLLNLLTVYIQAVDFLKATRNAAGTEFYQISLVLSMSALIACLHTFSIMSTPGYLYITVLCCTGLQLMLLCRDPEFDFSFTTSLYSFIFVAIRGSYIVVLTGDLQQEAILQLIYYLNLGLCFAHPIAVIIHGELEALLSDVLSIQDLFQLFTEALVMASVSLVQMAVALFMLKVTDPLMFIFAVNFTWVPSSLIQALVYKMDLMVSAFRAFWIFGIIFIVLLAREPRTANNSSRDPTAVDVNVHVHKR